jgi:hypothetical protein
MSIGDLIRALLSIAETGKLESMVDAVRFL